MKSQQRHKGRKERTREARRNRIRPPRRQLHTRPGVRANPEEQASNGNRGHEAHEPQSDADRRRDASNPTSRTPATASRSKATPATRPRPGSRTAPTTAAIPSRQSAPSTKQGRGGRTGGGDSRTRGKHERRGKPATATRRYGRIENGKQVRTRTHAKADGIATGTGAATKQTDTAGHITNSSRDHEPQDEDKQATPTNRHHPPRPST